MSNRSTGLVWFPPPAVLGALLMVAAALGVSVTSDAGVGDVAAARETRVNQVAFHTSGDAHPLPAHQVEVSRAFDRGANQRQITAQVAQRKKAMQAQNTEINQRSEDLQAEERQRKQWVLPVTGYRLTARFGQRSRLWSSGVHTGLDFAGPTGSPIVAVAAGTITSAGYNGSYGNRTIITLDDGTEIWYSHQSRIVVKVGDRVAPGQLTGYTGATGNVTGPHLHLEVRPAGQGPADPAAALASHGVRV